MQDKKPYQPPKLIRFGSIVSLTQGGTGSGQDGGPAYMNRMSDVRCKKNVVRIGSHPLGFGLYLFDYQEAFARGKAGATARQFGVLAQEVEGIVPEAVREDAQGIKHVDYRLLGIVH